MSSPKKKSKNTPPLTNSIQNSGGAFQTVQYAKKKNKEIVNLSDQ